MNKLFITALILTNIGCASRAKQTADIEKIRDRLRAQEAELQHLRDQNSILKQKLTSRPSSSDTIAVAEMSSALNPVNQPEAPARAEVSTEVSAEIKTPKPSDAPISSPKAQAPVAPAIEPNGDQLLYAKILESYQTGQKDDLFRAIELLEKGYPESEYVDNAIYMRGLYLFTHDDYATALKTFQVVREKYPAGNKVSAALFAEAMALKKLGKIKDAQVRLKKVAQSYPGSPEAQRVDVEMRLIGESTAIH